MVYPKDPIVEEDSLMLHLEEDSSKVMEYILNRSPAVVFLWKADENWPIDFVSENVSQFGYSSQDFYSGKIQYNNIIHPDDIERVNSEIHKFTKEGRKEFTQEYRILTKSGDIRWLDDRTFIRRNKQGVITHYQGIVLDITERKKAENIISNLNNCFLEFGSDSKDNIRLLAEATGVTLDGTCALYNRFENPLLNTIAGWQTPPNLKMIDKAEGHICYDVISKSKEPLIVRDLDKSIYNKTDPNVEKYHLKTYIGNAVKSDVIPVGSLCVVYRKDRTFDPVDLYALSIFSRAIGVEEERLRDQEALKKSEEESRRLSDFKSKLISIVSHELRSPLSVISEGVNSMLDGITGPINERQKDVLNKTSNNIKRLTKLINNILDYRHLEVGKIKMEKKKESLNTLVTNTFQFMEPLAKKKEIDIEKELPKETISASFDRERIKQVLINLTDNAIKYTENGGKITVKLTRSDKNARVEVADNGKGVHKEDQEKVFDMFYQAPEDIRTGSSGVGLAICRLILKQHKGGIWVESSGKGSRFIFELPLA